jgi:DNA-binding beta-propeller fold protein YncE
VDVFSVGPTPEGTAFSPDSKMLAVDSINGSNLKHSDPLYASHSLIQLFDVSARPARLLATTYVGSNAQGLAFAPDGKSLIVQDFASDNPLVFGVVPSGLTPLKFQIPLPGAPAGVAVFDSR